MKYIESQYLSRRALVQIDSGSGLNPATRELSRQDVPFDAEVGDQGSGVRGQVSVFRCQEVKGKKLILPI